MGFARVISNSALWLETFRESHHSDVLIFCFTNVLVGEDNLLLIHLVATVPGASAVDLSAAAKHHRRVITNHRFLDSSHDFFSPDVNHRSEALVAE
ncbi:hypothetical protein AVEN_4453-1 [Araneus ventricosus]|uniref:Uncharacterized protein n=1 Tax=Araneus ventricosus TaxID=182803 RepID=A0A4Y2AMN3_ARAVE|nr:hypothetical protein AVEN_4453-1 [Araneus ventricosus]